MLAAGAGLIILFDGNVHGHFKKSKAARGKAALSATLLSAAAKVKADYKHKWVLTDPK